MLVMGNKSKEKKQMIGMKDHSYSVDEEKRCNIYIYIYKDWNSCYILQLSRIKTNPNQI